MRAFFQSPHRMAFVRLLACFWRINNMNLFPFRLKSSVFLSEWPIRLSDIWEAACKFLRDGSKPTLSWIPLICLTETNLQYVGVIRRKNGILLLTLVSFLIFILFIIVQLFIMKLRKAHVIWKKGERRGSCWGAARCRNGWLAKRKFCQLKAFLLDTSAICLGSVVTQIRHGLFRSKHRMCNLQGL